MGEKDGAFRELIEGVEARADREFGERAPAVQLEMLGERDDDLTPPAGWDRPSSLAGPVEKRGGRPKGAVNKRSTTLARYFEARFRDPAAAMGELVSRDAVDLWREIGLLDPEGAPTLIEVIRLQAAVARDLLPYLHGKVPQKLDLGDKRPVFVMPAFGETTREAIDGVLRLDDGIDDLD